MGVGDMSRQTGGYWSDHQTHRNGLDVDVRYVRHPHTPPTEGENATLNIVLQPEQWDTLVTIDLLYCFGVDAQEFVDFIYINQALYDLFATPRPDWLQPRSDHQDHFHVRIYDPDGTNN